MWRGPTEVSEHSGPTCYAGINIPSWEYCIPCTEEDPPDHSTNPVRYCMRCYHGTCAEHTHWCGSCWRSFCPQCIWGHRACQEQNGEFQGNAVDIFSDFSLTAVAGSWVQSPYCPVVFAPSAERIQDSLTAMGGNLVQWSDGQVVPALSAESLQSLLSAMGSSLVHAVSVQVVLASSAESLHSLITVGGSLAEEMCLAVLCASVMCRLICFGAEFRSVGLLCDPTTARETLPPWCGGRDRGSHACPTSSPGAGLSRNGNAPGRPGLHLGFAKLISMCGLA